MVKIIHFLLAVLIWITTGCSPAVPAPGLPAGSAGFTLTDSTGRQVSFPRAPQRIVLGGRATVLVADAVYTFPEASRLITAASRPSQGIYNFIEAIDPQYAAKNILELDVSHEQVAALKPDAVLMKSTMLERLGKPLENLGFPVVYLDFETPEQYQKDLLVLGKIFQNEERGRQVAVFYQNRVNQIATALSGLADEQKPRLLLLQFSETDGQAAFNVPPAAWMQSIMAQMAGSRPVWLSANPGRGWAKVNLEQIAAWDADHIIIISYTTRAAEIVSRLKSDPSWQNLRAVKTGRLAAFPSDFYSWDQPDTRWILGLGWLAARLHPSRFPGYQAQSETRQFYQELYRLEPNAFQTKILPLLQVDPN